MHGDERLRQAHDAYDRSVFGGEPGGLPDAARGLDAVEADLCLARGKLLHAAFLDRQAEDPAEAVLFARAAELSAALGDERAEGTALFWLGCCHQVVRRDHAAAEPLFERSRELAERTGDRLMVSYARRHLGVIAHAAGRLDEARAHLEASTGLRRELGFTAGVAANLIGLAYLAAQQGRRADALATLDEATELATAAGAAGIARDIDEARANLS